jgi:eukaryotic-like serine/threonine-protein kinase
MDEGPRPSDTVSGIEPRYRLLGQIARGGMGLVLEVHDPSLRRTIAMKIVRADPEYLSGATAGEIERNQSRLLAEAQILAQLDHPGVVSIHELGKDSDGRAFFTMKRVHGHDFALVIRAHHSGDPDWRLTRAVGVLLRACEALAYAHQKGVVHRDLKPANVMVGRFGEVYVMDWGLAKVAGKAEAPPVPVRAGSLAFEAPLEHEHGELEELTAQPAVVRTDRESSRRDSPVATLAGSVVGTPGYMAPEQARAEHEAVGARTDVYALGAMLYHLLAGRHPYASVDGAPQDPTALVQRVQDGPPEPLARLARDAPEELVAITEKAMARRADERYPSMLALAEDLDAWLEGRVVRAHRTGAWAELCKWVGRNRGAAAAIVAVLLGLATTTTVQTLRWRDQERANLDATRRVEELRREDARNRVALASAALSSGEIGLVRELLADCPPELRGFEWRHLWRASDESARVLALDGLDLKAAQFLPGGREILSAGGGTPHRIVAHDLASGARLREIVLDTRCAVNGLSLSADGTQLAAFVYLGELCLWDARTFELLAVLDARLHGWQGAAFAPRGTALAAFGTEGVELWDAARRERLGLLDCRQDDIADVAWSPDGARLFASSWDGSVSVWDARTLELVRVLRDSEERVQQVECSPDGRWLAGGNWDSRLLVWDAATLELVARSDRVEGQVLALAWSPDSSLVAVGGGGAVVRLFKAGTWERVGRLAGETGRVNALAFSADGGTLVSASSLGSLRTFELGSGAGRVLLRTAGSEPPSGVAFAPDGVRAAVGWQSGVLELWDTRARTCLTSARTDVQIRHLDWSRDGRWLALAGWNRWLVVLEPDAARAHARIPVNEPTEVHFDPAGTRLAATSKDGILRVWTLEGGELAWERSLEPRTHGWPGDLFGASWSPDGKELVACNFDGDVEVRDAASGERLRMTNRPGMLFAQFAPDGQGILVSAYTGHRGMELLDAHTLEPRWTSHGTGHLWPVFSPAGERVFSANWSGFLGVWDARTGTLLTEIEGLPPGNPRLGVAPDGNCVLLAAGKYVTVFDARE